MLFLEQFAIAEDERAAVIIVLQTSLSFVAIWMTGMMDGIRFRNILGTCSEERHLVSLECCSAGLLSRYQGPAIRHQDR